MKKRVLALLLCLVTCFSLIAGCDSKTPTGDDPVETNGPAVNPEGNQTEDGLETVHVLCKYWVGTDDMKAKWENGQYAAINQLVVDLEEIGIRLKLEMIPDDTFANQVAQRIALGEDVPDLVSYIWAGKEERDVLEWVERDLILCVDDLLAQYDTDGSIMKWYEEKAPGLRALNETEDGKLYWFSYANGGVPAIDAYTGQKNTFSGGVVGLQVRRDWIEEQGLTVQEAYTPDELYDLVKLMQDKDANGNGQKDEVLAVSPIRFTNVIAQAFGLHEDLLAGYEEGVNKVYSNFYHENFPAYIQYMQRLYKDGILDIDSIGVDEGAYLSQNRAVGIRAYYTDEAEIKVTAEDDNLAYYPAFVDMDGDITTDLIIRSDKVGVSTYGYYFVPKGAKNPEAVVRLMDYVYSDKYTLLNQLGVEGKGYYVDDKGQYVKIPMDATKGTSESVLEGSTLGECLVGMLALPRFAGIHEVVLYEYSEEASDVLKAKFNWNSEAQSTVYKTARNLPSPTYAVPYASELSIIKKANVMETYASELLVDLIMGRKSLDKMDEYMAELEKMGLSKYIDVMQARRDRAIGITQ